MPPTPSPPNAHPPPITKLILVCCHAIWLGGPTNGEDEHEWALASFQHGETGTFIAHAELGVSELIKANGNGLLIFSGSKSYEGIRLMKYSSAVLRNGRSLLSRRRSLIMYAHGLELGQRPADISQALVRARRMVPASHVHLASLIHEERFAVDSFQNLMLALLLFCRVVGRAPLEVVLVTHAFKRERFLDLHCPTLRWDAARVVFRGLDPEWGVGEDGRRKREGTERGEAMTRLMWRDDPWGWRSSLGQKRIDRGWTEGLREFGPLGWRLLFEQERIDCDWTPPEGLHEVVFWDGGKERSAKYPGVLPWDQ